MAHSTKVSCPHKIRVWTQVPHPKYGDKLPYFVSSVVPMKRCPCGKAKKAKKR